MENVKNNTVKAPITCRIKCLLLKDARNGRFLTSMGTRLKRVIAGKERARV